MASQFSLGVVIPCHKPYIPFLKECLDSIEAQTEKPDAVMVMCSSSSPDDIPDEYRRYSFPLDIVTREEVYNQAQNRNEGAKRMNTEIVSFFDADDVMHPRRIEMIKTHMACADIVLHSYQTESREFVPIDSARVYWNELIRAPSGCVVHRRDSNKPIHHSQVSVKRHLLDCVRFPENIELQRREDSLFCGTIVSMGHIQNAYIENSLSWYRLR